MSDKDNTNKLGVEVPANMLGEELFENEVAAFEEEDAAFDVMIEQFIIHDDSALFYTRSNK